MEVTAHLRYLRLAPRKVRLVINLIRGLSVTRAADQLSVLPKAAATPILKLLNSAIANAEHNFHLERENLRVKAIVANDGPRLKRWQPRAFGRASEILKRTSHVTIVLEDLTTGKPATAGKPPPAKTKISPALVKKSSATAKSPTKSARPARPTKIAADKPQARSGQDQVIRRQGQV